MPRRGPLLVFGAATLWGTTGTAQALGPDGVTPATFAFIRMLGGALLVLVAMRWGTTSRVRDMPRIPLLLAIATMAGSQPLFFGGVERTGVAIGTIVTIGSGPLFAGVLGWIVRREAVTARWWVATAIALGGAALLVSGGESAGVDPVGLALALGAGLAWAVYLVGAKDVFEQADPVFAAGVVFVAAAVLLSPSLLLSDASWVLTGRGLAVAIWVAPIATGFSYVFFARGLRDSPVAVAATMTLAEPLTAAVLGLVILGEPALASTIGGIVAILVGLLVLAREG
jgi:DME family drug/metabolite transporter